MKGRKLSEIVIIGVLATFAAIVVTSFFFPSVWKAREELRVPADPATVWPLISSASEQTIWNAMFDDATIEASDDDVATATAEHRERSIDIQLEITGREQPRSVEFTTRVGTLPRAEHRIQLSADGAGTIVRWAAHDTQRRVVLGRFANLFVSSAMSDQLMQSLEALRDESERREVQPNKPRP